MPIAPNDNNEHLKSVLSRSVARYLAEQGRKGAQVARTLGHVGKPFTSDTGTQAAKAGWTEERRREQAERMRRDNPRKKGS